MNFLLIEQFRYATHIEFFGENFIFSFTYSSTGPTTPQKINAWFKIFIHVLATPKLI